MHVDIISRIAQTLSDMGESVPDNIASLEQKLNVLSDDVDMLAQTQAQDVVATAAPGLASIEATLAPLQQTLRKLDASQRYSEAIAIRQQILRMFVLMRDLRDDTTVRAREFKLVDRLAFDMARVGRYTDALRYCELAMAMLSTEHHSFFVLVIEMRAACCYVAMLDFAAAGAVIAEMLTGKQITFDELGQDKIGRSIELASSLRRPGMARIEYRAGRVIAQYTLGRYLAAIGELGAAENILTRALGSMDELSQTYIESDELAIYLGELLLDRANFDDFESLRKQWREQATNATIRLIWDSLHAVALYRRGYFSDAEVALQANADTARRLRDSRAACMSLFQRSQILAMLNRVDEAEKTLTQVAELHPERRGDVEQQLRLVRARRLAAPDVMNLAPVPAEEPEPPLPPLPESLFGGQPRKNDLAAPPERSRERVLDQWAWDANAVHLDLHHGELERALLRFAWLQSWVRDVDSLLVEARLEHLWAVVAFYTGDHQTAYAHANRAADMFADLDMPHEEWSACRVCCWSLQKLADPLWYIRSFQERGERLLRKLRQQMSARDELFFSLNKWSPDDEQVSWLCHQSEIDTDENIPPQETLERIAVLREFIPTGARVLSMLDQPKPATKERDLPQERTEDLGQVAEIALVQRTARDAMAIGARGIPMARLHPRWLPRDAAVATYLVLPDRLELFVMSRLGICKLPASPVPKLVLWPAVEALWAHLRDYATTEWNPNKPILAQISEFLRIEDLVARIPSQVRRLFIVPDGILLNVPFAALPCSGAPLVKRYAISLLPRLRWFGSNARLGKRHLGVAVTEANHTTELDTLPAAVDEVKIVTGRSSTKELLCDERATCDDVSAALSSCNTAHFACHGEFLVHDPLHSGLCLYDEWLTVLDVQKLQLLKLDIAILSACFGADVMALPSRDLVGLPVAFLLRGTGHVISSLWQVPDESAPDMMAELYREIARSGPSIGLATCQRRWLMSRPPHEAATHQLYSAALTPRIGLRWWVRTRTWWRQMRRNQTKPTA